MQGGLVRSARLFDIYKPAGTTTAAADMKPGERSLAVRLELLATDLEIEKLRLIEVALRATGDAAAADSYRACDARAEAAARGPQEGVRCAPGPAGGRRP